MSGMWVLVAVAGGGELFGVLGMFFMIPVAAVLQTVLREIISERLRSKNISPEKVAPQPPISKESLVGVKDELYDEPAVTEETEEKRSDK